MKNRLPVSVSLFVLALALTVRAEEGNKPSELKVLNRLAGIWKQEVTFKQSAWVQEERTATATSKAEWILGGRFMEINSKGSSATGKTEDRALLGYDPQKSEYDYWWYHSAGYTNQASGEWDEVKKTMTLKHTDDDNGIEFLLTIKFSDDDHAEWNTILKDRDGKTLMDVNVKSTREKPTVDK